jgi:FkbM family methyltransferase
MMIRGLARLTFEVRRARGQFVSRRMGLHRWAPNYAVLPRIPRNACVVDVGVGDDPDFAPEMARLFGARCLLVDPTRKHVSVLQSWCDREERFEYLWAALGSSSGRAQFFESRRDVSGSLLTSHRNITTGNVDAYEVPVVTLDDLLERVGGRIDVLKMDVEGAEFDVINRTSREALVRIDQILVEFHDGTVPEFTRVDRDTAIRRLRTLGFDAIEYNGRDVLFVRRSADGTAPQ